MKILSKLGIIFIICTMIMSYLVSAEGEEKSYKKAMEVMTALNIIDAGEEGFDPDRNITRGEFAGVLAKLMGLEGTESSSSRYNDVLSNYKYSGAIEMLSDKGIVRGFSDGCFYPDAALFYEEAVKMAVSAIGYGYYAENQGGFPSGYISYGTMLGVTDDILATMGDAMTWAMTAQLAFNTSDIKVFEHTSFGETYEYGKTETLLQKKGIEKIKGKVTATRHTSVDKAEGVGNGRISLGTKIYSCDYETADMLLGHIVIAYVNEDDEIVYISSELEEEQVIKIDADNITSNTTKNSIVYMDGDRKKTLNIKSASVIFNGRFTIAYKDEDFKFQSGTVEVIDSDNDDLYETVKIESYETFIVQKSSEDLILTEDNVRITRDYLEEAEFAAINDVNISQYNLSELSRYNVLSVARSKDEKFIRILVSDNNDIGIIKSCNDDEIVIGENTYELSKHYNPLTNGGKVKIRAGESYTVYIDVFGRVAEVVSSGGQQVYAYLLAAAPESAISSKNIFRLLVAEGKEGEIKNFYGTDKIKINGQSFSGDITTHEKLFKDGKIIQQLIKITFNEMGEITKLETAKNKVDEKIDELPNPDYDAAYEDYTADEFTLDYRAGNMPYRGYNCSTLEATRFKINGTCRVVFVIYEGTENEKDHKAITSYSNVYKPDTYPEGTTNYYDITENYETSAIVLTKSGGAGSVAGVESIGIKVESSLVEKVVPHVNSDGASSYAAKVGDSYLVAKDPELKDVAGRWYADYKDVMFKDLVPGSMVQFLKDQNDEITEMRIMYMPGVEPEYREMHNDGTGDVSATWNYALVYTAHGRVVKATNSGAIIYNARGMFNNIADRDRNWDRNLTAGSAIYLFDYKTGEVKNITVSDIMPGDEIWIRRIDGHWTQQVVIYR